MPQLYRVDLSLRHMCGAVGNYSSCPSALQCYEPMGVIIRRLSKYSDSKVVTCQIYEIELSISHAADRSAVGAVRLY